MTERPGEEQFSAADLEPSEDERRARRRSVIDRAAASLAVVSAGALVGGLVALGAGAAPLVFGMLPRPIAGNVMGEIFSRWDRVAMGASGVLLVAEIVRTWAARARARQLLARLRRIAAVLVALCVAYIGTALSPRIMELHRSGVHRGEGDQGAELEAVHRRAELVGKIEMVLALGLVALHVFTLRARNEDEDEEEDAPAPLPPGPRS